LSNNFICYIEFTYGYKLVGNDLYVMLNLLTDIDL